MSLARAVAETLKEAVSGRNVRDLRREGLELMEKETPPGETMPEEVDLPTPKSGAKPPPEPTEMGPGVRTIELEDVEEARPQMPPGVPPGAAVPPSPEIPSEPPLMPGQKPLPSNINREYMDIGDAALDFIEELQDANRGFTDQRRGVRSWEATKAAAAGDEMLAEIERLTGARPGTAWNAEQLLAGRQLILRAADELTELSARIDTGQASQDDMVRFMETLNTATALQRAVQGGIAEAGRALNAMKIKAAPGSAERFKAIQNRLVAVGGEKNIADMAKLFSGVTDPADIMERTRKLDSAMTRWGKAVQESWMNSILSGPPTHIVNMIGNTGTQIYESMVKAGAAAVGLAREAVTGQRGTRALFGEIPVEAIGAVQGVIDTFTAIGRERLGYFRNIDLGTEGKQDIEVGAISSKNLAPEADPNSALARGIDTVGAVVRVPGTMLNVEDDLFKNMTYRRELNALAWRRASRMEGDVFENYKALMQNPTKETHEQALNRAMKLTFTEGQGAKDGFIASMATSVQQMTQKHPVLKYLVPFVRTPANLAQYFNENSVLAPLTKKWREDFMAGGVRRDEAIARYGIAMAVTAGVSALVIDGRVTGQGPLDHILRKQLEASGWQPNSIKIGGTWYKYDRTDPIGTMFGIVANAVDAVRYSESDMDPSELGLVVFGSILENYANKTYLMSLADAFALIGSDDKPREVKRMLTRTTTGFMPYSGLLGSARRGVDETLRVTQVPGDFAETITRSFLNRVPGFSEGLPARIDWKGDPLVMKGGAAWRSLSPIQIAEMTGDEASFELANNGVRVRRPSYMVKLAPGVQVNLIELDGGKGHVYQQYQIIVGKERHKEVSKLLRSGKYRRATSGVDSEKATMLRQATERGLKRGREKFLKWYKRNRKEGWAPIYMGEIRYEARQVKRGAEPPEGPVKYKHAQEGLVPEANMPRF